MAKFDDTGPPEIGVAGGTATPSAVVVGGKAEEESFQVRKYHMDAPLSTVPLSYVSKAAFEEMKAGLSYAEIAAEVALEREKPGGVAADLLEAMEDYIASNPPPPLTEKEKERQRQLDVALVKERGGKAAPLLWTPYAEHIDAAVMAGKLSAEEGAHRIHSHERREQRREFAKIPAASLADLRSTCKPISPHIDTAAKKKTLLFYGDDPGLGVPREDLIDRVLLARGLVFWGGPPDAGKSLTVLDACVSIVVTEGSFAGRQVLGSGYGVLWCPYEGQDQIAPRYSAAKTKFKVDGNLPIMFAVDPPKLKMADDFDRFLDMVGDAHERLRSGFGVQHLVIVVDTLSWAAQWENENASGEVQPIGEKLAGIVRALAEQGIDCLIICIDHTGKTLDAGLRGSSAKTGIADNIIFTLADKELEQPATNHRLTVYKIRGGSGGYTQRFAFKVVDTPYTDRHGTVIKAPYIDWNPPNLGVGTEARNVTRAPEGRMKTMVDAIKFVLKTDKDCINLMPVPALGAPREAVRKRFEETSTAANDVAKRQAWKWVCDHGAKWFGARQVGLETYFFLTPGGGQ